MDILIVTILLGASAAAAKKLQDSKKPVRAKIKK